MDGKALGNVSGYYSRGSSDLCHVPRVLATTRYKVMDQIVANPSKKRNALARIHMFEGSGFESRTKDLFLL